MRVVWTDEYNLQIAPYCTRRFGATIEAGPEDYADGAEMGVDMILADLKLTIDRMNYGILKQLKGVVKDPDHVIHSL